MPSTLTDVLSPCWQSPTTSQSSHLNCRTLKEGGRRVSTCHVKAKMIIKTKSNKNEQVEWDRPPPPPLPLLGPAYGAASFLSDGMEWNWRELDLHSYTGLGGSVNLCISRATKKLHAQMMMTVWELPLLWRSKRFYELLSVALAHVRFEWAVPANQSIIDVHSQPECVVCCSLANPHTQEMGRIHRCCSIRDRFLGIFSCAWTTSVVDLRIS